VKWLLNQARLKIKLMLPMPDEPAKTSKRVLEPNDRISEVLFGLIMVLTFTGSLSVADAGRDDVRAMLIGALGCNLAWGIIDGILYLMGCLSEQGRGIRSLRALRKAAAPAEAHRVIADALPPMVAATLGPAEYESLRQKLVQLPGPPVRPRLRKEEWLGALAVFLWVFLITFPVTIPFIFMDNLGRAMRVSNAIAVVLLFLTGYAFGRVMEYRPWLTGVAMVVLGGVLVGITMALGG
jgi:VIT1/CCC1 family predicted Fe2+/Mn2+ transporter